MEPLAETNLVSAKDICNIQKEKKKCLLGLVKVSQPPNRYRLLPGHPPSRFQLSERPHTKILASAKVPSIGKIHDREFLILAAWPIAVSKKSPSRKVQLPRKQLIYYKRLKARETE